MGGIFGGAKAQNTSDTRIGSMRVQTSAYGGAVPLIWGTTRITGNLLHYTDFKATAHESSSSAGGKGGSGSGGTHTSYTYSASICLSLSEGIVNNVQTVWRDKEKTYGGIVTMPPVIVTDEKIKIPASLEIRIEHANFVHKTLSATQTQNQNSSLPPLVEGALPPTDINNPNTTDSGFSKYTLSITPTAAIYTFNKKDSGKTVYLSYSYNDNPVMYQSAAQKIGMTLFKGEVGQAPWAYLTAAHPDQAIPYSGMAYLAAANYDFGDSAAVQNHSFEINTASAQSHTPDANPAQIIREFLCDEIKGAGFPASSLGDLSIYESYVHAAGLYISPALLEQEEAASTLTRWLQATNSDVVWSEGVLKFIPYGDEPLTGNGATYTPNLTPIYDLNDDDFIGATDPITVKVSTSADAYNQVHVEYFDRANEYNAAPAAADDLANIDLFGLRPMSTVTLHEICESSVAHHVAQLILQRALYVRNTYEFQLGWRHCLLEPMDLVTLTDANLGLKNFPVRIIEIEESEDGVLSVIAEDWPFGIAAATKYPHQVSDGFALDANAPAGACAAPVIFETSSKISGGRQELMIAAAGVEELWGGAAVWVAIDGTNYKRIGMINGAARYGISASVYGITGTPDASTSGLKVDLTTSRAAIAGGTNADLDALTTLSWLGGELIAFRDAELTASHCYTLRQIARGAYGTKLKEHPAGSPFVRLDESVFKWEYPDGMIGQRISIKLASFNVFGGGGEDLASVQAYEYTLGGKTGSGDGEGGEGGEGENAPNHDKNTTIAYDSFGNVIITFLRIDDPSISRYELRAGDDFASGEFLAGTYRDNYFRVPLLSVIGKKLWICGQYVDGKYTALTYGLSFPSGTIGAVEKITVKMIEPQIQFDWPPVSGAVRYIAYFEDGGVTTIRANLWPGVVFNIPKYSSLLRVYAVSAKGDISAPFDFEIGVSGQYNFNEIVNIPLDLRVGNFANLAFTSGAQIQKVSLLGAQKFQTPLTQIDNAGFFTFGYNLQNVPSEQLASAPGAWFRQGFWREQNGFYESAPLDLGEVLGGVLRLNLTKTVTPYGDKAGSAYAHVLGEYLADATGADITDNKAFLSAIFYVAETLAGPWVEAQNGDTVKACRFVKIIIAAEHVSPLTDCLVTAGGLTLDVPDLIETGTAVGVIRPGVTVNLTKSDWHKINFVLLTPRSSAKAWPSLGVAGGGFGTFFINTDSVAPVDIDYYVKGY